MKRTTPFAFALLLLSACAERVPEAPILTIDGPLSHELAVSLAMNDLDPAVASAEHLRLFHQDDPTTEVSYQRDDLDGDGRADALMFLVGPTDDAVRIEIEAATTAREFPRRAQATLAVRQDGRFEDGVYVQGSEYMPVTDVLVPAEQQQDSDWAMFEGPVWESDLVGWRFYLDHRNRTDIFGKKIPDLVLERQSGDYHAISDWGADILKVGNSLGIGSPAIETGDGPQVMDNASSRRVEIVANGPLRAIIRTTYSGWTVGEKTFDVVSELENRAGQRWTEQRLTLSGDSLDAALLTGIVKHPDVVDMVSGDEDGVFFAYTYGVQTDQGHGLGMAVLVPSEFAPEVGPADSLTHLVRLAPQSGHAAYRYLASWELEPGGASDANSFESIVRSAAAAWAAERTLNSTVR